MIIKTVQASLLRSLLRLALTELDGEGRQTLRKHLDDGMEAAELYNMVTPPPPPLAKLFTVHLPFFPQALSLPRKVKGGERKCVN